jgi:hypothetical protein
MSVDELELLLARLDERSRSMEKSINQIVSDQKDTNKILAQMAKEQERVNILDADLRNLKAEVTKNSEWVDCQTRDQLKRKNDFIFELLKFLVIAMIGGVLGSLGIRVIEK